LLRFEAKITKSKRSEKFKAKKAKKTKKTKKTKKNEERVVKFYSEIVKHALFREKKILSKTGAPYSGLMRQVILLGNPARP
jgi:hypothetical protein